MMWMGACDEMTDFFFSKKVICKKCGCPESVRKKEKKMKLKKSQYFLAEFEKPTKNLFRHFGMLLKLLSIFAGKVKENYQPSLFEGGYGWESET